ncbi:hypothetical protein BpHYR1_003647 [Brachionus plicatilis]|uniref:Uncharacterized protein n=1 Tax=Brachionus plicatilis TaxID=10195 RepID=A0A3M7QZ09_BRAPC|nr:hypothetical protein BpHYR1_003647 [Brachionus plicatilis]
MAAICVNTDRKAHVSSHSSLAIENDENYSPSASLIDPRNFLTILLLVKLKLVKNYFRLEDNFSQRSKFNLLSANIGPLSSSVS